MHMHMSMLQLCVKLMSVLWLILLTVSRILMAHGVCLMELQIYCITHLYSIGTLIFPMHKCIFVSSPGKSYLFNSTQVPHSIQPSFTIYWWIWCTLPITFQLSIFLLLSVFLLLLFFLCIHSAVFLSSPLSPLHHVPCRLCTLTCAAGTLAMGSSSSSESSHTHPPLLPLPPVSGSTLLRLCCSCSEMHCHSTLEKVYSRVFVCLYYVVLYFVFFLWTF